MMTAFPCEDSIRTDTGFRKLRSQTNRYASSADESMSGFSFIARRRWPQYDSTRHSLSSNSEGAPSDGCWTSQQRDEPCPQAPSRSAIGTIFADSDIPRINALPFSGLGAAKPTSRFYADVSAATRSAATAVWTAARGTFGHKSSLGDFFPSLASLNHSITSGTLR